MQYMKTTAIPIRQLSICGHCICVSFASCVWSLH